MRYDLIAESKVVGVISLVEEASGTEQWLLEIEAFDGQQVAVKFEHEREAHQMAEEWALAQRQLRRIAATMERTGTEFTVR